MPRYAKKTTSRKRVYKRKTYKPSAYRLAKKAISYAKPEVKEITYPFNALPTGNFSSVSYGTGTALSVLTTTNGIVQGVGVNQRIGNKIKVIGIQIRMAFVNSDSTNNLRVFLIKPKSSPFGTGGVLAQNILSGAASSTTQWLAPIDTDRYYVYFDRMKTFRTMPLDGNSASTTVQTWLFKKFIKCKSTIQWDNEGNPDPRDYIIGAISDSSVVPHPGAIAGHVKVYYTDA